ncbi:MAG: glutamate-1-semialdehyde 2,1-aminomutase [Thermoplasmata archaeon]|nr:glutamate-1-semialdehyde 2,1-aminomutase [Thermoplasmata archaeon]
MNDGASGPRSAKAFRRARRTLVGGVDSPVRSFQAVGGTPVFVRSGRGAHLTDVDGRRYLDLVNSWGATILGHAPPAVVRAVRAAATRGLTYGAPTEAEHELGERILAACPAIERIRFVNSGTEAVMTAVRVARGFTGRRKVVKFEGGYHGHSDGLLAKAGSGAATHSLPDSAGVPAAIVGETLVAAYNDLDSVRRLFEIHGEDVAAVVVEPVAGNMGVVPPAPGFLAGLSKIARSSGALTIQDEVITGFRLRNGTVHERLGGRADLVTLGKVIGGGLPVGAVGGSSTVMAVLAPDGPVYQAGTLAGNPVTMAAGATTLDALVPRVFSSLERTAAAMERALAEEAEAAGIPRWCVQRVGSMLTVFFTNGPVRNLAEANRTDRAAYARYFHAMLGAGVYLPPSALETSFASAAMGPRDVATLRTAARRGFAAARARGR